MTVHSLPPLAADDLLAQQQQRTRAGRWKMLAVLLVCAAPVIASYFTYYVIRPEGRRNFGELIEPQRPVPAGLSATAADGRPVPLESLRGQWLLVSAAGGACDATCESHLYLQRQLRESLGKDKDRMDWVWLVTDAAPVREALRPALTQGQATVLRVVDLMARDGQVPLSRLAIVFQQPALDLDLSVAANLRFQTDLHGISRGIAAQRIAHWMERFGLTERAAEPCRQLSGGMRRKVELARALLSEPQLLLMDEATVGIDPDRKSVV